MNLNNNNSMEETNKDFPEKIKIEAKETVQRKNLSVDKNDDAKNLIGCSSLKVEDDEKKTQTESYNQNDRAEITIRATFHLNHQSRATKHCNPFPLKLEEIIPNSNICIQKEELASSENDSEYRYDPLYPDPELFKKNLCIVWPGKTPEYVPDIINKFSSFGKIRDYVFAKDVSKKGLRGFLYFESVEAAKNATEQLNGKMIENSLVGIKRF